MKPITREWVGKAEGDYVIAQREARARKNPVYDGVCFHAQQCAEKYLKPRLAEAEIPFGKTHNLIGLLGLVLPVEPLWIALQPQLTRLNVYAVNYRYPGSSATKADSKDALISCRAVRRSIRQSFSLPL